MKALNADLLQAQTQGYPTGGYQPAVRLILTSKDGGTTYDYSFDPTLLTNVLQHVEQVENPFNDSGAILISNYNRALPDDLRGYWVELGWGMNTVSGVHFEGADNCITPRLWVISQSDISGGQKNAMPGLYKSYSLSGVWDCVLNVQPLRLGIDPYYQDENGLLAGKTIYGCLEYLIETTLSAQTGETFLIEALGTQDDGLISTIIPFPIVASGSFVVGVTYRILTVGTTDFVTEQLASANTIGVLFVAQVVGTGNGTATSSSLSMNTNTPSSFETYGSYIRRLCGLTNCFPRATFGRSFKIIYPQSSDAVDKTYYSSQSNGHPFYEVEHRQLNMTPNHIEIFGGLDTSVEPPIPTVVGHWYDTEHYTIVTAGSFVVGNIYFILTVGSTDFTLIGASANTIGIQFTATDVGVGDGTAQEYSGPFMPVTGVPSGGSNWFQGNTTSGECDDQAAAYGLQLKEQSMGMRIVIPMDAAPELYDNIQVQDTR